MSSEDRAGRDDRAADPNKDARQERRRPEELVRFVKTKGTPVTGRHRDKPERIAETVPDLELACEGAFSLARRDPGPVTTSSCKGVPMDRVHYLAPAPIGLRSPIRRG